LPLRGGRQVLRVRSDDLAGLDNRLYLIGPEFPFKPRRTACPLKIISRQSIFPLCVNHGSQY
ncbi:MAG: hypothetical protein ABSA09_11810, partial [Desulfobaccales bacterium]